MGQNDVMIELKKKDGQTAKEIAEILDQSTSSVSECCRKLTKYGDIISKPTFDGHHHRQKFYLREVDK